MSPKIPPKKFMWVPLLRSFPGNEAHKFFFWGVLGGGQKVYVEKVYVLCPSPKEIMLPMWKCCFFNLTASHSRLSPGCVVPPQCPHLVAQCSTIGVSAAATPPDSAIRFRKEMSRDTFGTSTATPPPPPMIPSPERSKHNFDRGVGNRCETVFWGGGVARHSCDISTADQLQLARLQVTAGGLGLPHLPTLALVARASCNATLPRATHTENFRENLVRQEELSYRTGSNR